MQGFRKVDPDRWEFANEGFWRGQKHLLKNIRRRKTPSSSSSLSHQAVSAHQASRGHCVEVGRFGVDEEIDRLRRDKEALMMELVNVRQELQSYRASLKAMEERVQGTERKQEQMMAFLARAMQNPALLQQLVQRKEDQKEVEDAATKKRRRLIDQGPNQRGEGISLVKAEVVEFGEGCYQMSELESLAMEMQGFSKVRKEPEEESESLEIGDKELDDGFWDELFSERFEGDMSASSGKIGDDECVIILADR